MLSPSKPIDKIILLIFFFGENFMWMILEHNLATNLGGTLSYYKYKYYTRPCHMQYLLNYT